MTDVCQDELFIFCMSLLQLTREMYELRLREIPSRHSSMVTALFDDHRDSCIPAALACVALYRRIRSHSARSRVILGVAHGRRGPLKCEARAWASTDLHLSRF